MFFAEFFDERGIGKIGLGDKFFGGIVILFFLPMHGDLRFGEFLLAFGCFRI